MALRRLMLPRAAATCNRVGRSLNAECCDDVALLRNARILRRVQASICAELVALRRFGLHPAPGPVEEMLQEVDGELRAVLLSYPQISAREMRARLLKALARTEDALVLVEECAERVSEPSEANGVAQ